MSNFSQIEYYPSVLRDRFDASAEPTLEDGGAISSINITVADGGQVPDLVDGDRNGRLTVGTDAITGDDSTFASATGNWTLGTGVSITGGKLVCTGAGGDASIVLPLATADYEVIFTISGRTAGSVVATVGGTAGSVRSTNATFTQTITGGGTTTFLFNTDPTFDGSIDDLTIRLKDTYRADMALSRRVDADCFIVDNQNVRDVLPVDERDAQTLYHDTDATFSGSTAVTVTEEYAGQIGAGRAHLDLDGSDYVSVANDANLNFGARSSFVIFSWFKTTNASGNLIEKGSEGGGGKRYLLTIPSTGKLRLDLDDDATLLQKEGSTSVIDDTWTLGAATINRATGEAYVWRNGVKDSTALDISALGDIDDVTKPLAFGISSNDLSSAGYEGLNRENQILNRIPDDAEMLDRFNNPQSYPLATDSPATQQNITTQNNADFNLGALGDWANSGLTTFAYALFGGFDTMHIVADDAGDTAQLSGTFHTYTGDNTATVEITCEAWAVSGSVRLRGKDADGAFYSDSTTGTGVWEKLKITMTAGQAAGSFATYVQGGTGTDEGYFKNFQVRVLGAVGEWASEGIATTQSTWFDRANGNDGTISGAEGRNNPGNSIYFAKFTSVNARYWFLAFNPDSLTYIGAYKVGQWDLCKTFRPTVNPDVTGVSETIDQSGIDAIPKYGGGTDLNERYDITKPLNISYSWFLEADRAGFEDLIKRSKKRPFYFTLNADAAEPIIIAGRILGNPEIVAIAFGVYTVSFDIQVEPT